MRALIVTFVRAYNYGAVLQCYALSKVMRDLGADVQVLDYYPEYFRSQYGMTHLEKPSLLPSIHIRSWLKNHMNAFKLKRRNNDFQHFIAHNIPLTNQQFKTREELDAAKLTYDIFVSGSDQVWSNICIPFDPVYFLAFSSAQDARKCSYAASFGFSAIPYEMKNTYRQYLSGWDSYSVRESSAICILEDLLGVKSVRCYDPTLLLNAAQWRNVAHRPRRRKPYILIYTVNGVEELLHAAKELANAKMMDVIYIPCIMRQEYLFGDKARQYGFQSFGEASPDEWLELFSNADYVLTDSFHGTVFSLIYHKQFMVALNHHGGQNTRAKELLDALQIHGRDLTGSVYDIDFTIDWELVDEKLERMRKDSIEYLKTILEIGE